MKKLTSFGKGTCLLGSIILVLYVISYVINIVKLCKQDFDAPYKNEIIHTVGVVIPVASFVTVWYD